MGRWLIALAALAAAAALALGGFILAPNVVDAVTWLEARDDPAALATLGLARDLSSELLSVELAGALDADDVDLAASFIVLAEQEGLAVPQSLQARYSETTGFAASARRHARAFVDGAVSGDASGGVGLAGVVASDLTGVGDVRDLVVEGSKLARGEEANRLVLGVAAVGLVATGATIASVGAALPARAGVSAIRMAVKSGRLSKPLASQMTRLTAGAVDQKGLGIAVAAATRLDLVAARDAMRASIHPAALERLGGLANDAAAIVRKGGVHAAQESLALANDANELKRFARLAEARGAGTRAVMKVLGRGAVVIGSGLAALAGWAMAGIAYLWLALALMLAATRRIVGLTFWLARRIASAARLCFRFAAINHRFRPAFAASA